MSRISQLIDDKLTHCRQQRQDAVLLKEFWENRLASSHADDPAQNPVDAAVTDITHWDDEIRSWEQERRTLLTVQLPRVDVELVQKIIEIRGIINRTNINDIHWHENGERVENIPQDRIERFRLCGLNNTDFVDLGFLHCNPVTHIVP